MQTRLLQEDKEQDNMNLLKKLTPAERKERKNKLREKHQPLFDSLNIKPSSYIPKMAHNVHGLDGLYMGFFESELINGDVYTEKVSMKMESEDPERNLYKWKYNPSFKEDYQATEPSMHGDCRYLIPLDSLEVVKTVIEKTEPLLITSDPESDLPIEQITLRDYAAIHLNKPVSKKDWLNEIITSKIKKNE